MGGSPGTGPVARRRWPDGQFLRVARCRTLQPTRQCLPEPDQLTGAGHGTGRRCSNHGTHHVAGHVNPFGIPLDGDGGFADLSAEAAAVTARRASGTDTDTDTACASALAGARVVLAVRRPGIGGSLATRIRATSRGAEVRVASPDLADPAPVADSVPAWTCPLHARIDDAGVMSIPAPDRTARRREMRIAPVARGHLA